MSKKADVSDFSGSGNSSTVSLEALHQLAASYFIDRESTLRKLHHIQIASTAIKVNCTPLIYGLSDAIGKHGGCTHTHTHTHTHKHTRRHTHTSTQTHRETGRGV